MAALAALRALISPRARLYSFGNTFTNLARAVARAKFVKVFPNEYKRALGEINARKAANAAKAAKPVAA